VVGALGERDVALISVVWIGHALSRGSACRR
jgi:hypothetical protein